MASWLEITRFESPEAFVLLVIALPAVVLGALRRRPALRFSSAIPLEVAPVTWRCRVDWVVPALRMMSAMLLVTALARPQQGFGETRVRAEGVAIMVVVDRSWSMTERIEYDGRLMTRIDVVKNVFREFALGNGKDLPGRPHDMIGLVAFARFADTVCPLVRSHEVLVDLVDSISLVHPQENRYEAGTAIGDGIALAAARLEKAEERLAQAVAEEGDADPDFKIKSKAIILLTDGDENIREIPARRAAEFCRGLGIKVYAIGIGGGEDRGGFFARGPQFAFDGREIREVARITDGLYRLVETGGALRDVYAEIDRLEKTRIESIEHTSYAERFMPWAVGAASLLLLELVARATLLGRSP